MVLKMRTKNEVNVLCITFYENELFVVIATVIDRLFHQAYVSFRRFCVESENLPTDLHVILSDILQDAGLYVLLFLSMLCNCIL